LERETYKELRGISGWVVDGEVESLFGVPVQMSWMPGEDHGFQIIGTKKPAKYRIKKFPFGGLSMKKKSKEEARRPQVAKEKEAEEKVVEKKASKKGVGPQEVRDGVEKFKAEGKVGEKLVLEGGTFDLVRLDPWYGDNGVQKMFCGLVVEVKDTEGFGFEIKIKE
jgi:hypothetical protein